MTPVAAPGPGAVTPAAAPGQAEPSASRVAPALITAAAGVALTVVALTFGASTLFVPAAGLVLLGVLALSCAALAQAALQVTRTLAATEVPEGEALAAAVEVRRRILRPRQVVLCDALSGGEQEVRLPRAEATVRLRLEARFERRGRYRVPPVRLRVSDPLGLVTLERRSTAEADELLVLPAVERVRWSSGARARGASGDPRAGAGEPPAALEVDGIRPYRDGTPASRIHWPSVARGAGMMERRLRSDADDLPLVVLDPGAPASLDGLDAAVRAAASLTRELARRRGCRLLITGQPQAMLVRQDLSRWRTAHAALAVVEAEPHRPAGQTASLPATPLLLYVCAARPRQLPWRHEHGQRAVLVLPDELLPGSAQTAALHVAGCTGMLDVAGELAVA